MKKFVLDTNILLHMVRNSITWQKINQQFQPLSYQANVSVVTLVEILRIAKNNNWGKKKMQFLQNVLNQLKVIRIEEDLVVYYLEIEDFSQGKHKTIPLPKGMSARNMGKNDIWIAATTQFIGATLLTTDKDFEHLQHFNLSVEIIQ